MITEYQQKLRERYLAAGFSPSGQTLAVATSSDLTLWTWPGLRFDD